MRMLVVGFATAFGALVLAAPPTAAQTFYFGYSTGPVYYGHGYDYRPRRYYRRHYRRYRAPRYYRGPRNFYGNVVRPTIGRNGQISCNNPDFTWQDGACRPYRGARWYPRW